MCQTEEGREVFIQWCDPNFDAEREARAKQMRKKVRCTPTIAVDPTLLPPEELTDTDEQSHGADEEPDTDERKLMKRLKILSIAVWSMTTETRCTVILQRQSLSALV